MGKADAPSGTGPDKPRIVAAGEVRQRIPCSAAALRALDAAASAQVVARARRIVDATNLDDHHFDDVVRFGADLQAAHGKLAAEELAIVASEALAHGNRLGAELLHHLDEFDPAALFALRGGVLSTLAAMATGRDPAERFARLYPRIQALAKDLEALAPDIAALAERLSMLATRHAALQRNLAAHILAGNFLVRHVEGLHLPDPERQAHFAAQAEALGTRIASLLATQAAIAVGLCTLRTMTGSVETLAWSGEGLLREDLPAWHTAYCAALMAAGSLDVCKDTLSSLRALHTRLFARLRATTTSIEALPGAAVTRGRRPFRQR